ncbi:carbohydrate ABC transporter permease [Georgenia sp. EYE_87]|uniref:carbohydrate ABC transporter permease n=1 Tax=Georgenia sp. EYE_87 TaxID=2853448 RepID=UPI002004ADF0|nr:carbohydrate ABC transporter permease [Georgenia sp. EYE_87]MCK6210553.1 carbohydrate ABC transporter permease [Georgenia sp. EYE_87]
MKHLIGEVRTVLVYIFVVWCLAPVAWLVSTSLKSDVEAFSAEPVWIFTPQWSNYAQAWTEGGMSQAMLTSTIVAVVSSLVGVIGGLPLAYLTTQVWPERSNGSRRVALVILLLTTVPPVLGLTPLYRTFDDLGLSRTTIGITLIHSYYAVLLAVLILRSFLVNFPREVREAALIDGAGEWRTMLQCVAPNMTGAIFATLILSLIQSWNEYLYALVITGGATQTVPVRVSGFLSFVGTNWSTLTAAGVIGTLPIVVFAILARKQMATGLSYGGVK